MKILPLIFLLVLCSCAEDRAQIASDSRAGIRAVIQAQENGESTDQLAILRGVDARLPAVAEVNSAEWPSPKMTVPQVIAAPREYFISAPPEPSRAGAIATIIAVSVAGLGLLRIVAPLIPGGGPVIKTVADLAWKFLSDKEQKKADAEQARLADLARPRDSIARFLPTTDQRIPIPEWTAPPMPVDAEQVRLAALAKSNGAA